MVSRKVPIWLVNSFDSLCSSLHTSATSKRACPSKKEREITWIEQSEIVEVVDVNSDPAQGFVAHRQLAVAMTTRSGDTHLFLLAGKRTV